MNSIAWKGLFRWAPCAAVCLQAAFLTPYVVLVPGERTNVFTSLLTLLPAALLALGRPPGLVFSWRAALPWLLLGAGLAVSAAAGTEPFPAALRALSFYAPAVGGLACAWGLLRTARDRDILFRLLTLCFAGLAGAHLVLGMSPSFMGLHHHAVAGALVLLSAGPIRLLGSHSRAVRLLALGLLLLGAAVCFGVGSRFVILLPFVLLPVYMLRAGSQRRTQALAGLAASALVAAVFFSVYPDKVPRVRGYESVYYRVEAFPATWAIVKEHGLLGVGIRTPRKPFLADYEPVSGLATREEFEGTLERNVTWDNQYLSLLCGVGVPLTLLYLFLAGALLARFLRGGRSQGLDPAEERAMTFALLASVVHFAVHDGLFYPQINWFFHLLLGAGAYALPGDAPAAPAAAQG